MIILIVIFGVCAKTKNRTGTKIILGCPLAYFWEVGRKPEKLRISHDFIFIINVIKKPFYH